jgi:protein-S-isoprenylcysteine O-methyltransferase Ste14
MNCPNVGRHLRAVLLLPSMATVVVPGLLVGLAGDGRMGWGWSFPWSIISVLLGVALAVLGLGVLVWTAQLLAVVGRGTLAPWDPTVALVVAGPYRHVRNPMMKGVFAILAGEAVALGSPVLVCWFAGFVAVNVCYVPLVEEKGLEKRFGDVYREYKAHVPRWIPRISPWSP